MFYLDNKIAKSIGYKMIIHALFYLCFFIGIEAVAQPVDIPLNIGVGPSVFTFSDALKSEQQYYYGIHLDLAAVIDKEMIKHNQKKIPQKYRSIGNKIGEVQISHLLIPSTLILSPRIQENSLFGVLWNPIGINQPIFFGPITLRLGTGVLFSYIYISENDRTTHFIRPGIDVRCTLKIKLHERFLLSGGFSTGVFIPQTLGGFGIGGDGIWNINEAFLLVNYRHPIRMNL